MGRSLSILCRRGLCRPLCRVLCRTLWFGGSGWVVEVEDGGDCEGQADEGIHAGRCRVQGEEDEIFCFGTWGKPRQFIEKFEFGLETGSQVLRCGLCCGCLADFGSFWLA